VRVLDATAARHSDFRLPARSTDRGTAKRLTIPRHPALLPSPDDCVFSLYGWICAYAVQLRQCRMPQERSAGRLTVVVCFSMGRTQPCAALALACCRRQSSSVCPLLVTDVLQEKAPGADTGHLEHPRPCLTCSCISLQLRFSCTTRTNTHAWRLTLAGNRPFVRCSELEFLVPQLYSYADLRYSCIRFPTNRKAFMLDYHFAEHPQPVLDNFNPLNLIDRPQHDLRGTSIAATVTMHSLARIHNNHGIPTRVRELQSAHGWKAWKESVRYQHPRMVPKTIQPPAITPKGQLETADCSSKMPAAQQSQRPVRACGCPQQTLGRLRDSGCTTRD
jgi:hypothetical protein